VSEEKKGNAEHLGWPNFEFDGVQKSFCCDCTCWKCVQGLLLWAGMSIAAIGIPMLMCFHARQGFVECHWECQCT